MPISHVEPSMDFEVGLRQVLGEKAYGSADLLTSPSAKKLLLETIKKLSRRADDIVTMDERLRDVLLYDFSKVGQYLKKIDKGHNQVHIIGLLLGIIGTLLGYDWLDGKVHRTPVYFRTKKQEFDDYRYRNLSEGKEEEDRLVIQRQKICINLKEQGMPLNQIARVLNMSEYAVNQLLRDQNIAKIAELLDQGHSLDEIKAKLQERSAVDYFAYYFDSFARERTAAWQRTLAPPSH